MKEYSENAEILLYHGTCEEEANNLVKNGWKPETGRRGGNEGQPRFLYLTNIKENALWFAQEKGCDVIVKVLVPVSSLKVDPEDGISDTVYDELTSLYDLPGYVVLYKSLSSENFSIEKV